MFEVLATLTEDGPSLAEFPTVWAAYERLTILLECAIGHHQSAGSYAADGSLTMPAWLRTNCHLSHRTATAVTTRGRFLHTHPIVADAAAEGRLSLGHVSAIQRNTCGKVADLFDIDHQTMLVTAIERLPVADAEHACKVWRMQAEALLDEPEPNEPERSLSIARTPDGTLHGTLALDSAAATELETALATAATWDGPDDTRTKSQRDADALFEICSWFNANHNRNGTPRHRPHIELIIHHTGSGAGGAWTGSHRPTWAGQTDSYDAGNTTGMGADFGFRPDADRSSRRSGREPVENWPFGTTHPNPDRHDQLSEPVVSSEPCVAWEPFDAGPDAVTPGAVVGAVDVHPPGLEITSSGLPVAAIGDACHGCGTSRAGTAATVEGEPLSDGSTRAFLCDCVIHRVTTSPGWPLEYGRAVRTIPRPLFRVVALRDGGCRFPGCCRKIAWCDGHHLVHWEDSGTTDPDNVALLCARHHHLIHQRGWTVTMDAQATLTFTNPHGTTTTSRPHGQLTRTSAEMHDPVAA